MVNLLGQVNMSEPNPAIKLCECGCGEPAPITTKNHTKSGAVKGQPRRFIHGHHLKKDHPPWWRGDDASYGALHTFLRKHFPKTGICEECGEKKPTDYALIKGREYSRNREDYRELCRRCHVFYDETGYCRYWKERGLEASSPGRPARPGRPAPGPAPACKCGCGTPTEWDKRHGRWNLYAPDHWHHSDDAPYKDEAWLRREYTGNRRSLKDIAAECGVNRTTVAYYVRQFGIAIRNPSEAHMRF